MTKAEQTFRSRLNIYRIIAVVVVAVTVIVCSLQQLYKRDGDPELFVNIANLIWHGKEIYGVPSDHGNYYFYPPFFAVLNILLIPLPVEVLTFLWTIVSVGLLGWIIVFIYSGIAERPFFTIDARTRWIVCGVTLLLSSRAIISHLRYGQTNVFVLAMVVFGLYLLIKKQSLSAGLAVALSAAVKLTTLPYGIWFLYRSNLKVLSGMVIGVLIAILLPALIVGFERDVEYHKWWVEQVALKNAPGTGDWAGIGNVSLRAQADRFFMNIDAFEQNGTNYRVTLVELSPGTVGLIGYGMMFCIAIAILGYAFYFRDGPELVSKWGGFAFVSSLAPNFTPVTEIPHLVLLIPAHIYVVHLLFVEKLPDRIFRVMFVLSFVLTTLSTKTFMGEFVSRWLTAVGSISFGMILLTASVFRAGYVVNKGAVPEGSIVS